MPHGIDPKDAVLVTCACRRQYQQPSPTLRCLCGRIVALQREKLGREGMVTVYDHEGEYVGCMGVESWEAQLRSGQSFAVLAAELERVTAALREALVLRNAIFRSVPVRDETRDAHFDLEHLRQVLVAALAGAGAARAAQEDK
jgi:hypothetical protein